MAAYLMAIDIGTTGANAMLFDTDGNALGAGTANILRLSRRASRRTRGRPAGRERVRSVPSGPAAGADRPEGGAGGQHVLPAQRSVFWMRTTG